MGGPPPRRPPLQRAPLVEVGEGEHTIWGQH